MLTRKESYPILVAVEREHEVRIKKCKRKNPRSQVVDIQNIETKQFSPSINRKKEEGSEGSKFYNTSELIKWPIRTCSLTMDL